MIDEETRAITHECLERLLARAMESGRETGALNAFLRCGNGDMGIICRTADRFGCFMVVKYPDRDGWYSYGRNWYEILKQVIFHFWNRMEENPMLKDELFQATGINPDNRFHAWIVKRYCAPKLETFLKLCQFEGVAVDWRHRPKYLDLEPWR